jgi:hypothetical protein
MTNPGLGKNLGSLPGLKGRGRKYFLSKSQNKALADVATGKQESIVGALRAANPQERFSP